MKTSNGIICVKKNALTNEWEVLLLQKKTTYAYNNFLHGNYNIANFSEMRNLFSQMTIGEKFDILSFNYQQMWTRCRADDEVFMRAGKFKIKFDKLFNHALGKEKLINFISNTSCNNLIWEIPKGRRDNSNECDLQCAIREFCEETNLRLNDFHLLNLPPRIYQYTDCGVSYCNQFWIAVISSEKENKQLVVDYRNLRTLSEINNVEWCNINFICKNVEKRMCKEIKHAIKLSKKYW